MDAEKRERFVDVGDALMQAVSALRLCAVGLNDANQALPCGLDLKCSDGTGVEHVYFGAARAVERIADLLEEAWRTI